MSAKWFSIVLMSSQVLGSDVLVNRQRNAVMQENAVWGLLESAAVMAVELNLKISHSSYRSHSFVYTETQTKCNYDD